MSLLELLQLREKYMGMRLYVTDTHTLKELDTVLDLIAELYRVKCESRGPTSNPAYVVDTGRHWG